jgi:hypothetical protein
MQRRKTIGNSFGFIDPSESRLRRDTDALNYPDGPYSAECVEEEFCELRLLGILGSCARPCNPSHLATLRNTAGLTSPYGKGVFGSNRRGK